MHEMHVQRTNEKSAYLAELLLHVVAHGGGDLDVVPRHLHLERRCACVGGGMEGGGLGGTGHMAEHVEGHPGLSKYG